MKSEKLSHGSEYNIFSYCADLFAKCLCADLKFAKYLCADLKAKYGKRGKYRQ